MGCYICSRCDRLRESREHGFCTARELDGNYDNEYCEECFTFILEEAHAGTTLYRTLNGNDMSKHVVTEDLEIVEVREPPR